MQWMVLFLLIKINVIIFLQIFITSYKIWKCPGFVNSGWLWARPAVWKDKGTEGNLYNTLWYPSHFILCEWIPVFKVNTKFQVLWYYISQTRVFIFWGGLYNNLLNSDVVIKNIFIYPNYLCYAMVLPILPSKESKQADWSNTVMIPLFLLR